MELLTQHVRGMLIAPAGRQPVVFHALLDSGLIFPSISETLGRQLRREVRESITQPFQGDARVQSSSKEVRAVEWKIVSIHLRLKTLWGSLSFQLPFVSLPGPDNLIVIYQVTPREVLGMDVMHSVKRSVLRSGETTENDASNAEDGVDAATHSSADAVETWSEGGAQV